MEPEIIQESIKLKRDYFLPLSILISVLVIAIAWIYTTGKQADHAKVAASLSTSDSKTQVENLEENIIPTAGVVLPVKWRNLGMEMVEAGVIDAQKFEALYAQRGGLSEEEKNLLYGSTDDNLKITSQNSGFLLNLLWAFGLGNKNEILEKGEMSDPQYGGAGRFASTGGWTLAKGETMNHYSGHQFVKLTSDEQAMVERVSQNIYRPCCNNSTHFPDCNHGMAMLGLLELMASQGASEEEMYKTALLVNSYWFPDTYLTIASYFNQKGIAWDMVDAKEVLGANFSSGSGFRRILEETAPVQKSTGAGCGV